MVEYRFILRPQKRNGCKKDFYDCSFSMVDYFLNAFNDESFRNCVLMWYQI